VDNAKDKEITLDSNNEGVFTVNGAWWIAFFNTAA
jgi:hypothetical protein